MTSTCFSLEGERSFKMEWPCRILAYKKKLVKIYIMIQLIAWKDEVDLNNVQIQLLSYGHYNWLSPWEISVDKIEVFYLWQWKGEYKLVSPGDSQYRTKWINEDPLLSVGASYLSITLYVWQRFSESSVGIWAFDLSQVNGYEVKNKKKIYMNPLMLWSWQHLHHFPSLTSEFWPSTWVITFLCTNVPVQFTYTWELKKVISY